MSGGCQGASPTHRPRTAHPYYMLMGQTVIAGWGLLVALQFRWFLGKATRALPDHPGREWAPQRLMADHHPCCSVLSWDLPTPQVLGILDVRRQPADLCPADVAGHAGDIRGDARDEAVDLTATDALAGVMVPQVEPRLPCPQRRHPVPQRSRCAHHPAEGRQDQLN